jgi:hypothetical protein
MESSTMVSDETPPVRRSLAGQAREARLRLGNSELYPGIPAGEWRTAAVMADQVLAGQLLRGVDAAIRGRVLLESHFEFRGGVTTGGERGGMRPQRARA